MPGAAIFGYVLGILSGNWYANLARTREEPSSRNVRSRDDEKFRQLTENSPDLVMILEKDSTISYVSPSVSNILGYSQDEFVRTPLSHHLEDPAQISRIAFEEVGGCGQDPAEIEMKHADGSLRCLEMRSVAVDRPDNDVEAGASICYARDVTARAASEKDLFYRAFHDHLTGLPNEALFMERLEHTLSRFPRYQERVAVLFLDLDNFKAVNDQFGHRAGDQVLITVSQRLESCLRPMDTAARLHGDEFAILVENVPNLEEASRVCERLVASLREPVEVDGNTLHIMASVGVVLGRYAPLSVANPAASRRCRDVPGQGGEETLLCDVRRRPRPKDLQRLGAKRSDIGRPGRYC